MPSGWNSDNIGLFLKRNNDVMFSYIRATFMQQIEWPTSDMAFCTYCGSRVKRGVDCPNCGSSWGMQPPPDRAIVTVCGRMPEAGCLMDLPRGVELDVLHKHHGYWAAYKEEEVAIHMVIDKVMRQLISPLGGFISTGDYVMLELELLASVTVNWQQT